MKFKMAFNMENAAFGETWTAEVERVFDRIVEQFRRGDDRGKVMDSNGNSIWTWEVK